MMGDPKEWTDSGGNRRDIKSIQLDSQRWEWQDNWGVDLNGIVGVDFDMDGWEYSSSFSKFTAVSKPRTIRSMDCCRRRRWIRTRVPASSNTSDNFVPLSVIWNVSPLSNGAKKVILLCRIFV